MPTLSRAPVRTRRLALALLLLPLAPGAAFAAAATTSETVNLRAGPAASYDVVGQLQPGAAVDVRQCEGKFCQVAAGGKIGWVSASFLTRGAAPAIASRPAPPVIAAASPGPAPAAARAAALPPAYAKAVPPVAAPLTATASAADDATADGAPRPKVGIPGDNADAPVSGAYFTSTDDEDDDAPAPPDDFGPRHYQSRGFGSPLAGVVAARGRACFIDMDGGGGFCVGEGQSIAAPGRWSQHGLELRNPDGLNVTVCGSPGDCSIYVASGPVLSGGQPISTISVAAPGY